MTNARRWARAWWGLTRRVIRTALGTDTALLDDMADARAQGLRGLPALEYVAVWHGHPD